MYTLLENSSDDALVCDQILDHFPRTKLFVTKSFAISSSVTYSEIHQNISNSVEDFFL